MSSPYPRGAARRLCAAAVLGAGVVAAGPAAADYGATHVVKLLTPVIEIESDGAVYTKPAIALTPVAASVNVVLDAHVSGRIKSYKVWLKFRTENSDWVQFPQHAASESFPLNQRPKTLNNDVFVSVPYGSHDNYLVSYCNLQANALRNGGMSDEEIFSQDRPIEVGVHSALEYEMSGASATGSTMAVGGGWGNLPKMTVVCKSRPPVRVPSPVAEDPTRDKPDVLEADLAIVEEGSLHGACAIHLSGVIRTREPNTAVKFRYRSGDGQESDVKTVVTDHSATAMFSHEYPLPEGGAKTGQVRIDGVSENFGSEWQDYAVNCGSPAQDVVTVLPPKAIAVEAHLTGEEVMHRGLACPASAKIFGVMKGRGDVDGAAALFADGQLKKLAQYSIADGQTVVVEGEYAFDWTKTQLPQQNVKFTFNISNKGGDLVDQMEATQNFTCRQIKTSGVAQGAVGGFSGGQAPETARPVVGGLVAPQGFAIQAPKGIARQGEIRLSGGAADAKYKLTFLRKNGGGYVAVNAAQLPKQMTGLAAGFPLKALTGGRDWRLEVCPLGGQPAACKTADFRLPHIGGGAAAKAGTPAQPPAAASIVPKALQ